MKKYFSRVAKLQFFSILVFMMETVTAQNSIPVQVVNDSLDRYGAIGIRPGIFSNLGKENSFTLPVSGIFIDYSFGKFRHSIEMDFLTRKYRKFFKNTYSPCFAYHFSVKKQLRRKMELYTGGFVNCRKDVINRKEYINPLDTSDFKRGLHTIFSLGPSVEIVRRIFLPGKSSFLTVGARITYSFDVLGYGYTYHPSKSLDEPWGKVAPKERFLRDAVTFSLKIGWGKLIRSEQISAEDVELRVM